MNDREKLSEAIDRLQLDLSAMEPAYEIARKRKSGEDAEWEMRKRAIIDRLCRLVRRYKVGDDPHIAVSLISQAGIIADELVAPDVVVAEYTDKKQMLSHAQREMERQNSLRHEIDDRLDSYSWYRRAQG